MHWVAVSTAFVVFTGSGVAQTVLPLPASHVAMEGTIATNVPFGRSTPTRVQYVYDNSLFGGPVTITGVQFRVDGGAVVAGKTIDCEMSLSTLPSSLTGLSAAFAQNRGADEIVVLPRQLLSLPAQNVGAVPNPFLPAVPLTTPFVYDPQAGGLVLEIVVHGQPPGGLRVRCYLRLQQPAGADRSGFVRAVERAGARRRERHDAGDLGSAMGRAGLRRTR